MSCLNFFNLFKRAITSGGFSGNLWNLFSLPTRIFVFHLTVIYRRVFFENSDFYLLYPVIDYNHWLFKGEVRNQDIWKKICKYYID